MNGITWDGHKTDNQIISFICSKINKIKEKSTICEIK